jgi:hypothetical protein
MAREVPPELTPLQVAESCRVSKKVALGWLRGAGILETRTDGRRMVQESRLREARPDIYARVYSHFVLADSVPPPAT